MGNHYSIIEKYIEEDKYDVALNYIEKLPESEKQKWETKKYIGLICLNLQEYHSAISFFRSALRLRPNNYQIYYYLGIAYGNIKEYNQSELMFKMCELLSDNDDDLLLIKEMRNQVSDSIIQTKNQCILMVAYYFPPLAGSGVFRSIKFAKYLPDNGWNPIVISAENPPLGWNYRDDEMKKEINDATRVIRIRDSFGETGNLQLNNLKLKEILEFWKMIFQYNNDAMKLYTRLVSTEDGIKSMLTFPCVSMCWAYEVIQYIEKNIDIKEIPVIYTTSGPYSSHLIGFYFKEKYGTPWVADFRDPWINNAYFDIDTNNIMHALLFHLENILLHHSDYNIVVSEESIKEYKQSFNIDQDRMTCITNGYDDDDFVGIEKYCIQKTKKFTIVYSGLLYTKHRSVEPILEAIRNLIDSGRIDKDNIVFKVVGSGNESDNEKLITKYNLSNIFVQTGYVSHKEAICSTANADLLLILVGDGNRFKSVIHGKLFDYLRVGKPIIAITPPGGEIGNILLETNQGIAFDSSDITQIEKSICKEYDEWLNCDKGKKTVSANINQFNRKYLTMKLSDVLYQSIANPREI